MSQADFHRDPASDDAINSSAAVPRRIVPPPPPAPPIVNPPRVASKTVSATPARKQPAPKRAAVVPPPPPPRSTLPPVRQPAAASNANGVGSAKGVRWRGELQPIRAATPQDDVADELSDLEGERRRFTVPPWLISLVLHLVFLLVLALITTPVGEGIGKLMLTIGSSEGEPSVDLTEFEIATDDTILQSENVLESNFEAELDLQSVFEVTDQSMNVELEEWTPTLMGEASSEIARPMFGGRTGAMKAALLAKYGGTAETQEAVRRGLEWLKRNQTRKGGWSMKGPYSDGNHSENEASATAMALLAFLGDGHTHQSGDYTDVVEKAMKYLVSLQDRSGFMAQGARGHEQMYAQAQATIALCELYGMTKDSWLRPRVELAVDFAERSQSPQGGWRYQPNQDSDTSVTGWFVLSLMSAQSAGLEINDSKLRDVSRYLDTAQSYEGAAYSYQPRGAPTPAMTAEGLLCRQYLGWEHDSVPMVRGVEALAMDYPFETADQDVYYWYYATQILHHFGGKPWQKWNEVMRVELPAMQIRSGRENGSWAPQGDAYGSYGRIYTTCLSIFCLEVYYRHMPLYQ